MNAIAWIDPQELFVLLAIKATVIIVGAALVVAACRRLHAAGRAWVWALTMLGLLLAPLIISSTPALVELPRSILQTGTKLAADPGPSRAPAGPDAAPTTYPMPTADSLPAQSPRPRDEGAPISTLWIALITWIGIATLLLLRLVVDWVRVRHTDQAGVTPPAKILALGVTAARDLGSRPIRIRLSAVPAPCTYGVFRPVILLPFDAPSWSDGRLRAAVLHEAAHGIRGDHVVILAARLASALYWPNPLVWWAARRTELEAEHACDDVVLQQGISRIDYAEDLLCIARSANRGDPTLALGMARSSLARRVFAVLADRSDRRPLSHTARWLAFALLAGISVPVISLGLSEDREDQTSARDLAIAELAHADTVVRQRAAWRLGDLEARQAVPALLTALVDPEPEVRGIASWALGEIKDAAAVPSLLRRLDDEDPYVVDMALRAIGECQSVESMDVISRFLDSDRAQLGAAAAFALGELDAEEAIQRLADHLPDTRDVHTRIAIVHALGQRRADDAVSAILACLEDPNSRVRVEAVWALGRIGDQRTIDSVLPRLRDPEATVRDMAVWALDELTLRSGR